jgi:site-specific DNA-methyltransferase (adenine-specific)
MKGCGGKIAGLPCCTVILGDCEQYIGHLTPGCVDLIVTDPPYGMSYKSANRKVEQRPIHGDDRFPVDIIRQLIEIPRLASYVFCRWDNLCEDVPHLKRKPKSVIAWVKRESGGKGDLEHEHSRVFELALFYPGPEHAFRRRPPDVVYESPTGNALHPTQKPVPLIIQMLEWYNFKTVLDPYIGSGSTLRAARQMGKHFLGFEIDPKHHAEAVHFIERPLLKKKSASPPDVQPQLLPDLM